MVTDYYTYTYVMLAIKFTINMNINYSEIMRFCKINMYILIYSGTFNLMFIYNVRYKYLLN